MTKAFGLAHLHSQSGQLDLCTRCGEVWDDTWPWVNTRTPEFENWHATQVQQMMGYAVEKGIRLRPFKALPVRAREANHDG